MALSLLFIGAITPLLTFLLVLIGGKLRSDYTVLAFIFAISIVILILFYLTIKYPRYFYTALVLCFICLGIFFPLFNQIFIYINQPNELLLMFSALSLFSDGMLIVSLLVNKFKNISILTYALLHTLLYSAIVFALTAMVISLW